MAGNKNSGRRARVFTSEERQKVKVLTASGMTQAQIAHVLKCSVPTLVAKFKNELEIGQAEIQSEMIMARYNSAKAGNVSAQNKMIEMTGAAPPPPPEAPKAEPKKGKKEQAQEDAMTAHQSSDWGSVLHKGKPTIN